MYSGRQGPADIDITYGEQTQISTPRDRSFFYSSLKSAILVVSNLRREIPQKNRYMSELTGTRTIRT